MNFLKGIVIYFQTVCGSPQMRRISVHGVFLHLGQVEASLHTKTALITGFHLPALLSSKNLGYLFGGGSGMRRPRRREPAVAASNCVAAGICVVDGQRRGRLAKARVAGNGVGSRHRWGAEGAARVGGCRWGRGRGGGAWPVWPAPATLEGTACASRGGVR